ncbi:Pvc16 family protein [Streptomyces sp. NPDC127033]|uniref:Pvc16 family protein n=1 Tax=Streptomyces sp. NPDC127033 TaxID=3347110 RepID=UPI00365D1F75
MSNALAVATVTQALALLIGNNLSPEMDIAVTVETRKPPAEPPTEPTINVFLYQVAPNPSMRHTDLPTRASDGRLVNRAAAALDLNYLISAYGDETTLVGQRLIGCVVRTLHEIPVLPKDLIELAAERPYLAGSDLAASPQRVRFTPTVMDIDETSKLWGMLHQTPYTLSVAYQASLVLIEGREKPVPAKPVERRTVRAVPFRPRGDQAPEPNAEPNAESPQDKAPAPTPTFASTSTPEPEPVKKRAPSGSAPSKRAAPSSRTRKTTASGGRGRARSRPAGPRTDTDAGDDGKES